MSSRIKVEVVLATPVRQLLMSLEIESGATIADVIEASGISDRFPDLDLRSLATGVWGRLLPRDHIVRDGDRVELYRPLQMDPREARRRLATAGLSMGQAPQAGDSKDPG